MAEHYDYITCPHCGKKVALAKRNRLGRKPLKIGVKNICDTLRDCHDITLAAEKLGCSRGYIYEQLKRCGTTPKKVVETDDKNDALFKQARSPPRNTDSTRKNEGGDYGGYRSVQEP